LAKQQFIALVMAGREKPHHAIALLNIPKWKGSYF